MNGTRFIVRNMYDYYLDMESLTGQRILLPRIDLTPSDSTLPFSFTRRKFPIRIAFAMTINKAQGQTLDKVGLYLPQPAFSHDQLYIAMSRVRSFEELKI
uniref:ATP-dependent DNA helicase PIF1 n=1 Tax=Sipha flava TaxID=143950 RepID=A0A2S2QD14_9HEMI